MSNPALIWVGIGILFVGTLLGAYLGAWYTEWEWRKSVERMRNEKGIDADISGK